MVEKASSTFCPPLPDMRKFLLSAKRDVVVVQDILVESRVSGRPFTEVAKEIFKNSSDGITIDGNPVKNDKEDDWERSSSNEWRLEGIKKGDQEEGLIIALFNKNEPLLASFYTPNGNWYIASRSYGVFKNGVKLEDRASAVSELSNFVKPGGIAKGLIPFFAGSRLNGRGKS